MLGNEEEIIRILKEIQDDMGRLASGRLKKEEPIEEPEVAGMKVEVEPLNEEEAKEELAGAMEEEEPMPRWKKRMMKGA